MSTSAAPSPTPRPTPTRTKSVVYGQSANHTRVHIKRGAVLTFALGDNLKAVDNWEVQTPHGLDFVDSDLTVGAPKGRSMKGATFTRSWMFAANKKGTYLVDATAFSKGEPAAVLAEFVLTVVVS